MASKTESVICKNCRLEYPGFALFCPNCGTAKSRDESGDPILGTTVADRYLLLEQIGQGASGTIYRAEHVTLRRRVAVKVLHHELSQDDLAIERFRREATTVGELDNDHILQILDFGRTDDGRLYLAMEYLEGETLASVLEREGKLDAERATEILVQLCEALVEAHAMGYVHRDLRPRNLFLAIRRHTDSYLKLLDFGLAKLVESEGEAASTSLGMTFGDPHYMSPEQARGDPVDRRADIYSMGCIGYEMLTGEPPFHGGKVFDVLTRHVEDEPVDISVHRSDLPAWLARAIMRCLAKSPDGRFITAYRLIEALKQGTDSGIIMSDEVARRRETEPPPSVSRAMERLGRRASELEGPAARADERRDKKFDGGATMAGVGKVGQREAEAGVPVPVDDADSTGDRTDRVGTGAGKRKVPAASSSSGISAAWYADGEALEGGRDLDERDRARLDRARGHSPSRTGIVVHDDLYYDEERRPWTRTAAIVGGLIVVAVAVFLLWPEGKKDSSGTAASTPAVAASGTDPGTGNAAAPSGGPPPVAAPPDAAAPAAIDASAAETGDPPQVPPEGERTNTPSASGGAGRTRSGAAAGSSGDRPRKRAVREPVDQPDDSSGGGGTAVAPPIAPRTGVAEEAAALATKGQSALRAGDILGAAANFKKARELDPKNADAAIGLGEIALGQGAFAAAVNHLKKATALRSRSSRAHTLLGEAYLGIGNDQQAAASFKRALQIDPDNARARDGYNEATGAGN